MKIEYSKDIDALYVYFREKTVARSKEIEEGVTIDLGDDGHIIGVEILDATQRLGRDGLTHLNIEHFPIEISAHL